MCEQSNINVCTGKMLAESVYIYIYKATVCCVLNRKDVLQRVCADEHFACALSAFGRRQDKRGIMWSPGRCVSMAACGSQLFPPPEETDLQTADFLTSIFIDWLSARDSNLVTVDTPRTAFPVFIPFDTGIRVDAARVDCTSEPG